MLSDIELVATLATFVVVILLPYFAARKGGYDEY